jgi:hypothetical protein
MTTNTDNIDLHTKLDYLMHHNFNLIFTQNGFIRKKVNTFDNLIESINTFYDETIAKEEETK